MIESEEIKMRSDERRLLMHDPDVNNIIQTRLETGKWFISSQGFLMNR